MTRPQDDRAPSMSGNVSARWLQTSPPAASTVQANILLAEDDPDMRRLLAETLHHRGHSVVCCRDGVELVDRLNLAFRSTDPARFDLVISDVRMPGITGLHVLSAMQGYLGFPPVILITAFGDELIHWEAVEAGAVAVLDKPFEMSELLAMMDRALNPVPVRREPGGL